MNRRALFTALAACTAALSLSACGDGTRAPEQPAAQSAPAAQEEARMIIFIDPVNCRVSRQMKPDIEAFLATPAGRNVTVYDAASPEGYAALPNYRINGQPITHVPMVITLRGNEIVGSAMGRQTPEQLAHMLNSARSEQFITSAAIPAAANITAQYRRAP